MRRAAIPIIFLAAATPARALDCAAAKAGLDRTICGAPALKSADDSMAAAYTTAREAATGAMRDALLYSQRAWIKRRGYGCETDDPKYIACLTDDTNARRAFLQGKPESGPGAGAMKPVLVTKPGRNRAYEIDVELVKFVEPETPGERTFNAEVAKLIADIPKNPTDVDRDVVYSHDLTMRVTWASPKLVSARLDGYDFEGGAHGNPSSYGLNIDMASGRKLTFADAFDAAAHQKLAADCLAQVMKEKKKRLNSEPGGDELKTMRQALHKDLGDLSGWSFSAAGATVTFGPYELGAYVEGPYACDFPLARLKELAKPSFPLPE